MKRLAEELDPSAPNHARALLMLQSAGPLPASEVSLRRVQRRLQLSSEKGRAAKGGLPLLGGALLFVAGSAGAAYGVLQFTQSGRSPSESADDFTRERTMARPTSVSREQRTPDQAASAPTPEEVSEAGTASQPVTGPSGSLAQRRFAPSERVERTATMAVREAPSADPRLLHQAVEALRRGKDPEKAARLLKEYARSGAAGPLSEEALALSIEAAIANDDPNARELARRYLAAYPEGRFRRVAASALAPKP